MIQLSAVIISFNEEKNIGRCLDSLQGVVDDIVVVDSFSTDRTEEIVKSKEARFVQHKFDGHIEQKNWAITQAKYPHIISIDSDEALSEELKKSILDAKKNWKYDGFFMNRLTNYCGTWVRHCGWYPDKKLRLWDSRKGHWAGINPHDEYVLNEKNEKTNYLKGDILHYSYYTIEAHYIQAEKFSTIAANALFQKGKNIFYTTIFIKAIAKFIRNYFIKLGLLDGKYGFIICRISAYETYLKYSKLYSLQNSKK